MSGVETQKGRLGDDDRFGNKTCQAAVVWAEDESVMSFADRLV